MDSGVALCTRWAPRTSAKACKKRSRVMPTSLKARPAAPPSPSAINAKAQCSADTYSSFRPAASSSAWRKTACRRRVTYISTPLPETRGRRSNARTKAGRNRSSARSMRRTMRGKTPSSCSSSAKSRCSPSTSPCWRRRAWCWASCRASCNLWVNLLVFMLVPSRKSVLPVRMVANTVPAPTRLFLTHFAY